MPYDYTQWKERVASRSDITGMLTHLTKPAEEAGGKSESEVNVLANANLIRILMDQKIQGSTTDKGFIVGNTPAVCFQDAPLYGLIQNVEHEASRRTKNPKERYRYCGVGLCFAKSMVYNRGGRPVFYERTELAKKILPKSEHWRIVNFDLSDQDNYIDWTHEREWRHPNDFEFSLNAVSTPHVLLYDYASWKYFMEHCPGEIQEKICGTTILRSVLF